MGEGAKRFPAPDQGSAQEKVSCEGGRSTSHASIWEIMPIRDHISSFGIMRGACRALGLRVVCTGSGG